MEMNSLVQTLNSFLVTVFGHWVFFSNWFLIDPKPVRLLCEFLLYDILAQISESISLHFCQFKGQLQVSSASSTEDVPVVAT